MSNTSVPVKTNTFSSGQTISSALVNQDFDQLFAGLADIGTANLLDNSLSTAKYIDASISLVKLVAAVQAALCPTGTILDYVATTAPTGWVLSDGKTIGNAASGGTERANADTETLFTLLWNNMADAEAAVSTGRGASAAADFAANKTIALPDLRGRSTAGKDNMGGTTASRLTATYFGAVTTKAGTTNGAVGGLESHTLSTAQLASHNHIQDAHNHLQDAHSHTQNAHNHTQDAHNHTQDAHTHTDSGHAHAYFKPDTTVSVRNDANQVNVGGPATSDSVVSGNAVISSNVATNQAATSTNQAATATNIAVTPANQANTATNQSAGSNTPHQVVQPTLILSKIIKL